MTDRANVWTGELNETAASGIEPAGPIGFYDTTLRDGEQTVGVVLSPEDKLRIAQALDGLGVERIEAGFPRVSADDYEAVKLINQAGLRAEVWGFSRAVVDDVEALVDLGVSSTVIESPVSDLKLDAYGLSRDQVVDRVTDAVAHASAHGIRVAYFGVDGSRADLQFLERVYTAAVEAGASEAVVVDTLGALTPEAVGFFVARVREWLGPDVPIHFHGHDDFGLATASAVAAVRAGATWLHGTVNGMGERAGNGDICEIALTLAALYGVESRIDLTRAREVSSLVRELAGYDVAPWKPVVGENLFTRESGAVASQFHDPPSIEPFSAEIVDADRRIVLGKKSGVDSIRIKGEELGLDLAPSAYRDLLAAVKQRSAQKRGLVSDEEFRDMVATISTEERR